GPGGIMPFSADANNNLRVGGATSAGGAQKAILLPDATAPTSAPSTGGVLCAEAGTLRYRGSHGRLVTLAGKIATPTANYTVTAQDEVVLATGGAGGITITLPTLVNGMKFTVKKVDAGAGAVTVTGGANIDGAASKVLAAQHERVTLVA